jgi:hypothetical protein
MSTEYISSKNYAKDLERFKRRGQAVHLRLHSIDDITKPFMQSISKSAAQDFEKWQTMSNQIRHYRNTLAHNPRLGMLLGIKEKAYVPKESKLNNYELWSDVGKRADNEDFVLLDDLILSFQQSLVERTNSLWMWLITFMDHASSTKGYEQLLGTASKIIILDDSQLTDPIIPPPSGSYPEDPHKSSVD